MGSFSLMHWLILAVILIILFGPRRLPEVAKGLGQSIRDFKKAMDDDKGQVAAQNNNNPPKQLPTEQMVQQTAQHSTIEAHKPTDKT